MSSCSGAEFTVANLHFYLYVTWNLYGETVSGLNLKHLCSYFFQSFQHVVIGTCSPHVELHIKRCRLQSLKYFTTRWWVTYNMFDLCTGVYYSVLEYSALQGVVSARCFAFAGLKELLPSCTAVLPKKRWPLACLNSERVITVLILLFLTPTRTAAWNGPRLRHPTCSVIRHPWTASRMT